MVDNVGKLKLDRMVHHNFVHTRCRIYVVHPKVKITTVYMRNLDTNEWFIFILR